VSVIEGLVNDMQVNACMSSHVGRAQFRSHAPSFDHEGFRLHG
jgi:hypothetical protein